jgi:sugar phosphate isomerase/epimerase
MSDRRDFLRLSLAGGLGALTMPGWAAKESIRDSASKMRFGLVTYLWGRDLDLPTLITTCEKAKVYGVELRVEHKHGVSPRLSAEERREVKKRFDDSPVTMLGMGSNECFDSPDPEKVKKAIKNTKAYVLLSRDVGGSGVKVKPNDLHIKQGIPRGKTVEQIGRSLNEVGRFAAAYGQQIRLEVHGSCSPLPITKDIMDIADQPNVTVCWNCNGTDLKGKGLEYNFNLVKDRFGDTLHTRELDSPNYPYAKLMTLLKKMDYRGWVLLEARNRKITIAARAAALAKQRRIWEKMITG